MKKLWMGLAAVALVMSLGVTGALAAGHHGRSSGAAGSNYTCSGTCCANFADTDGDGICDYHGTGCGTCFADSDGDGICDNYGTGLGAQHHSGRGHGGCWNQ